MTESEKRQLDHGTELLVREAVEAQVSRKMEGYALVVKYAAVITVAVFGFFGLGSFLDITSYEKATYQRELNQRLDSTDASSVVMQYRQRLGTLYRRAVLDAAVLSIQRRGLERSRFGDSFKFSRLPTEDINELLEIVRASDTADGDFFDALSVLENCSMKMPQIVTAIAEAFSAKPQDSTALTPERRAALVDFLAEAQYAKVSRTIRGILADSSANEILRIAAVKYAGRVRDFEAMDSLIRLSRSESAEVTLSARTALGIIQPQHETVKKWVDSLEGTGQVDVVAEALGAAAEISGVLDGLDQAPVYTSRQKKLATWYKDSKSESAKTDSKREQELGSLFSSLLAVGQASAFSLRSSDTSARALDEAMWDYSSPTISRSLHLAGPSSMRPVEGRPISSRLIEGRHARRMISEQLDVALRRPSLESARLLRFWGAVDEVHHLAKVTATIGLTGIVSTSDGRRLTDKLTTEITFLADPDSASSTIVAYWRDYAGQAQSAALIAVEGDIHPVLRLVP